MSNLQNNSGNKNPNKGKGGRHKQSLNKFSKNSKQKIFEHFEDDLKRLDKLFAYVPMDERFQKLKIVIKILCSGNDEVSIKTKELIYETLEREFTKLKFYINQLPQNKKAIELRQYLFCLDKNLIEKVFNNMA